MRIFRRNIMDGQGLTRLFQETTTLKQGQVKTLIDILLKYEESDELAYEIIGMINSGIQYTKIKQDLVDEKFVWNSCAFEKNRKQRASKDALLSKPPEIREGEIECPKCHQKKTLVVEMQTRSLDEGFTYSIHCFNPKCKAVTK